MSEEPTRWSYRAISLLKRHRSLNQNVFIPCLILIVDILIRFGLKMDLSDAGADMTLLAESALVATFVEDLRGSQPKDHIVEQVFMVALWFIIWLVCLMVVAGRINVGAFRLVLAIPIGLASLIVASILLSELDSWPCKASNLLEKTTSGN